MPTNIFEGGDRAGIFSAVRYKRFRPLWTASILSGVAYITALTACGWVAFELHHHSTVGVVFAAFLASIIITPFAGVFADRYDRRTMLLAMNAVGLLAALGLAWFAWEGRPERLAARPRLLHPRRVSLVQHADRAGDAGEPSPCTRSAQRRLPSPGQPERRTAAGAAARRAVAPRRRWRRRLPGRSPQKRHGRA
jgi:Major Facilitator Superfamily